MGRRPGRTQRIANDATPLNAARVDVEARIGWLLAMSRLHHVDESFGDGRLFAEALSDAGVHTSRSALSRYESGDIPVSYEAMAAYETVLGLPPGQLSSITAYVGASLPGIKTRLARPRLDPTDPAFAERLDDLIECAEDGKARARDWLDLGWHLAAVPLAHLRAGTWETLAATLVGNVPRTVKLAYRQYSAAAFNIALVPRAQDFLVDAIADYVSHPDVQVVTTPVGLLDRLPTRHAARLVLDLVEQPRNEATFRIGVWLAAQKLAHDHFTEAERDRLDMIVLSLWRQDPVRAADQLAELIAELPAGIRSSLVAAARRAGRRKLEYVVEHGEELPAATAEAMSHQLAEHARTLVPQEPAYTEDPLLTRLVREALFHRDSERRHLAALFLASSPFGGAVTDCLLMLLHDRGHAPWVRGRVAVLVRYLSDATHRLRMMAFLEDPVEEVRAPIAQGLGHLPFSPTSDQALRASLNREWSLAERAKMYALGMSGSPGLAGLLASTTAPEWQRSAARWWTERGPALYE